MLRCHQPDAGVTKGSTTHFSFVAKLISRGTTTTRPSNPLIFECQLILESLDLNQKYADLIPKDDPVPKHSFRNHQTPARANGHLRTIINMIEAEEPCLELRGPVRATTGASIPILISCQAATDRTKSKTLHRFPVMGDRQWACFIIGLIIAIGLFGSVVALTLQRLFGISFLTIFVGPLTTVVISAAVFACLSKR